MDYTLTTHANCNNLAKRTFNIKFPAEVLLLTHFTDVPQQLTTSVDILPTLTLTVYRNVKCRYTPFSSQISLKCGNVAATATHSDKYILKTC